VNAAKWVGNVIGVNRWHGVTHAYKVVNGKRMRIPIIYKTNEYRAFVRSLAIAFKQQLEPVKGLVHVDMLMFLDASKDTDGPFKPIFDALQLAGVIENDRLNHRGTYDRYDKDGGDDIIVVSVKELVRDDSDKPRIHA